MCTRAGAFAAYTLVARKFPSTRHLARLVLQNSRPAPACRASDLIELDVSFAILHGSSGLMNIYYLYFSVYTR